ncbi:altronate hydrolase [Mucilaginibacter yixingensis]|uniref:Altronate hydrolase n=1 Tax=Mucilaginibacter yixingensis TaxID=1295612 RepID=A0A2T5JGG6_9SPHI|nr:UxaA family hydrolase [Mucilaginibacter yixingensis]PTR01530.1 altronate hydrolase [Mucilaginibacter yixingensis]
MNQEITGYLRSDGRKGIRNILVIAYLVECAHFVADEIASHFRGQPVHVIGFSGCYPNTHADRVMNALCVHPNVGAVLLLSLGCESFNKRGLAKQIENSGRSVHTIIIQQEGGTRSSIAQGCEWVNSVLPVLQQTPKVPIDFKDLIVGTICGGSDATSGITANPGVGRAFDKLVTYGATTMFEETGEMIGLENHMAQRAATPELAVELGNSVNKAARYYTIMGHGSFAPGNADGGLSTIEEKSMGAYSKSGQSPISGLLKPGDIPRKPGLYLLDVVPDGEPRFGFPNINDSAEISELMACGCHIILFTTGRGSVVGSAISPVIKICANPETYDRLKDDMDINAGRILTENISLDELADDIIGKIRDTMAGEPTCSEALGHREFVLSYKSFEPVGPACLPA